MKLVLCPRCELNYMAETDRYCKVCQREMNSNAPKEEPELCTICNESPVIPGRDICVFCLKEMKENPDSEDEQPNDSDVDTSSLSEMESMATMDDILPDVPESEEKLPDEMENALSLESVREEEEKQQEEEDAEEEEI